MRYKIDIHQSPIDCQQAMRCSTCTFTLYLGSHAHASPCGHLHHINCIQQWLQTNNDCPICRREFRQSDLLKIFLPEEDTNLGDTIMQERIDDLLLTAEKYQDERDDAQSKNVILLERLKHKIQENVHLKESQTSLSNTLQKNVDEKASIWKRYRSTLKRKNEQIQNLNLRLKIRKRGVDLTSADLTGVKPLTYYFQSISNEHRQEGDGPSASNDGPSDSGGVSSRYTCEYMSTNQTFGDKNYDLVYGLIRQQGREEAGIHKDSIFIWAKRNMSKLEFDNALDFLSINGHIYSTIDEEHFKSTDGH